MDISQQPRRLDNWRVPELLNSPQDNATVLCSPPGVFPCALTQLSIHGTALSAIRADYHASHPGVDNQTGAGLEGVGSAARPCRMKGIEQSRCGNLCRGLRGARSGRVVRIYRHAAAWSRHLDVGGERRGLWLCIA